MKCEICCGACCEEFSIDIDFAPASQEAMRWIELRSITPGERLTFEAKCRELSPEGRCQIYEDRPIICEVYPAGGPDCLKVVKRRRTAEQYQAIREEHDPESL